MKIISFEISSPSPSLAVTAITCTLTVHWQWENDTAMERNWPLATCPRMPCYKNEIANTSYPCYLSVLHGLQRVNIYIHVSVLTCSTLCLFFEQIVVNHRSVRFVFSVQIVLNQSRLRVISFVQMVVHYSSFRVVY